MKSPKKMLDQQIIVLEQQIKSWTNRSKLRSKDQRLDQQIKKS